MTYTDLKQRLIAEAKAKGVCVDGYGMLKEGTRDEVIDFYLTNIDWCLERSFPSFEILHREFSNVEDKGVYISKVFDGETFDKHQVYVFHNCKGTINVAMDYDNAIIPMLYFANGCNIRVKCVQANAPKIIVPLYIASERHNCVVGEKGGGCEFKRYIVKMVEE